MLFQFCVYVKFVSQVAQCFYVYGGAAANHDNYRAITRGFLFQILRYLSCKDVAI